MDVSDSSSDHYENAASSSYQGILTDPYIPSMSKLAIKDGVWYKQHGGKAVTISKSKKRKLQKRYGSIMRALRAVNAGIVRPSQLTQTPEQMWREVEGLQALHKMPPVPPPKIFKQVTEGSSPKANMFC